MKLKLTLDRDGTSSVDLVIETDARATVADVAAMLLSADPHRGRTQPDASPHTLAVAVDHAGRFAELPPDAPIADSHITSGATVRLVRHSRRARHVQAERVGAVLRVVGGPLPAREIALPAGSTVIGRAQSAGCRLDDPMISRYHARVEVGQRIELIDLNSANGIVVDGGTVMRLTVQPGQVVTLGDTAITITSTAGTSAPGLQVQGGAIAFNRSPLVRARYTGQEYPRPTVPSESVSAPFPWLMMLAPAVMGAALYAATRNIMSLLFVVMSPLMMGANYFMTRSRQRSTHSSQVATFTKQLNALTASLTQAAPVECRIRNEEAPATGFLVGEAKALSPILWSRRPEHWNFLHVRLGLGRAPSRDTVAQQSGNAEGLPEYEHQLAEAIEKFRLISDVPITESLATCGALGVAGPEPLRYDVMRSVVAQLTTLHSPAEVVLAAVGGVRGAHEFDWLKWLPHTSAPQSPVEGAHLASSAASGSALLSSLEALVASRSGERAPEPLMGALGEGLAAMTHGATVTADGGPALATPVVVLLVADDAPVDTARLVGLAETGPPYGVFTVWAAAQVATLPAVCRTFVDLAEDRAAVNFVRHGVVLDRVAAEGLSRSDAEAFAHALASVTDAGAAVSDASDLPRSVSTLSLIGPDMALDPAVVIDRWRQNFSLSNRTGNRNPRQRAGTLRALVGQSGVDAMHLDLRTHGPHALVGGTTGSGKSEFLQTWVLGIAAEYSPDRVTFLFVDYKGGSAFAECVNLPHSVGIVTDLSTYLVRRALESLRAELRRREELFARKRVKDIIEFERSDDPECPPALIIVIDEFAALVGEVPEFVDGVVDVAQRGRSLGIHLIMATQRPAGVIRGNLRANTNLRIALRMADESDSVDVVGEKVAASFDPTIPGRAVAKTGPGRLTPFQAGFSGGWTTDEPPPPSIAISELRFGVPVRWEAPAVAQGPADHGPNDLSRSVSTIRAAAAAAGIPSPRRPWLPQLPVLVNLADLAPRNDREMVIGLADLPREQAQRTVFWRPDIDGNLAVYGTSGSGKSVVLRTLAVGAAITPRGGPVHVYGLDCAAGGLRMLDVLPHVGAIIPGDDSERVIRLFRQLRQVAEVRAQRFSAANAENIVTYRERSTRASEPRIIVLLDGFATFRADYEGTGPRGKAYEQLQRLIAEGRALGIHVVFTADRPASVPGAIASGIPRRIVLRMADDSMYRALDVPADILGPQSPPGRAIIDGVEAQVALLGASPNAADQYDELRKLARSVRATAPGVASLPTDVDPATLPPMVIDEPVLGIGDSSLAPIGFAPEGVLLVGGGPGSGRSNALAALCMAIRRWDPARSMFYIGNRRSDLPRGGSWEAAATSLDDAVELAKSLASDLASGALQDIVIVIESIGDFLAFGADSAMASLVKAVRRADALLIAEAETSTWTSNLPPLGDVKSGRRGLLLQPDTVEGDVILKTTFPRVARSEFPPGRGLYVDRGRVERVQLPNVVGANRGALPVPKEPSPA